MTAHLPPVAILALRAPEGGSLVAVSRPDGPRDGVDAVSELAVLAAAGDWEGAALAVPVRLRDVANDEIVARHTLVTFLERRADGGVEMCASGIAGRSPADVGLDGVGQALDPARSPMAPLLFDATIRVDSAPPLQQVVAVLEAWGHDISSDEDLPDVDHAGLARDRHRVHRLARDLGRRNRPVARIENANRPGVPANLPAGFVPACPL